MAEQLRLKAHRAYEASRKRKRAAKPSRQETAAPLVSNQKTEDAECFVIAADNNFAALADPNLIHVSKFHFMYLGRASPAEHLQLIISAFNEVKFELVGRLEPDNQSWNFEGVLPRTGEIAPTVRVSVHRDFFKRCKVPGNAVIVFDPLARDGQDLGNFIRSCPLTVTFLRKV